MSWHPEVRGLFQKFRRFFYISGLLNPTKMGQYVKERSDLPLFTIHIFILAQVSVCLIFGSKERVVLRGGRAPIFAGFFTISQEPFDLEKF